MSFHCLPIELLETGMRVCVCVCVSAQLCPTLCNPKDCSPPGSSVHVIFQARILEWVTISYSTGYSPLRDRTCNSRISCAGRWILFHCATWEAPETMPRCKQRCQGRQGHEDRHGRPLSVRNVLAQSGKEQSIEHRSLHSVPIQ